MIQFWHPPGLRGITLARGIAVHRSFPLHWHDEYQMVLIEKGAGEAFYRGATHPNPPSSLLILHPGEMHSNRATVAAGCTHRSINIAVHWASGAPYFPPVVFDADLIASFSRLHRACEASAPLLERESRIVEFLAGLSARYAAPVPVSRAGNRRAVRLVRDYLAAHAAENPSLETLAAIAGLSRFHLLRLFRADTGIPPHAWLKHVRILRARRLLAEGQPIADVAAETGFADQSHLTRHFKALVGVTPGSYRSKNVQDVSQPAF